MSKRLIKILTFTIACLAIGVSSAQAITANQAKADATDYAGDVCNTNVQICNHNVAFWWKDVDPTAGHGTIQWVVQNRICFLAPEKHEVVQTAWGPYSTSVESTPLAVEIVDVGYGGCPW